MVNIFNMQPVISLRTNIQSLNYCYRNMCISSFVPLSINSDSLKKKQDIEKLYEVSELPCKPTKAEILSNVLDINETKAKKILNQYSSLKCRTAPDLSYKINLVKSNLPYSNLCTDKKFWLSVCRANASSLDHRVNFLKEFEIPVTGDMLLRYDSFRTSKLSELYTNVMHISDNIPYKIFSELGAPEKILSSLPSLSSFEDKSIIELWLHLFRIFLNWQLDISEGEFASLKKKYRFIIGSFSLQLQNIIILKKHLDFDNHNILRHPYLLFESPLLFEPYFNNREKVCGVDIFTFLKKTPSILTKPLLNIKEIGSVFDFVNIKQTDLVTYPRIFTYSKETMLKRIVYYINKTSLDDFRLTPNNILLLFMSKNCTRKLEEYEKEHGCLTSIPYVSLLLPSTSSAHSTKAIKQPIVQFLRCHLDIKEGEGYRALKQIGLIHYPEAYSLKQNLVFLLNNGFSIDVIRKSYHIIVYPHEIVQDNFHNLPTAKSFQLYKQNNDNDKILQLLLYNVNKTYKNLGGSYL